MEDMLRRCAYLGIEVPEGATEQELLKMLQEYYATAVPVRLNDLGGNNVVVDEMGYDKNGNFHTSYEFRQTNKEVQTFTFRFILSGTIEVTTEDIAIARVIADDEIFECFNTEFPYRKVNAYDPEITIFG